MTTFQETVVLVHGIYMSYHCMGLLAWRLEQVGYRTLSFSYASLRSPAHDIARALRALVQTLDSPTVHFVGHSFGGVVIRHLFAHSPYLPLGRVVTLGTPHQGSQIASRISAGKLRFILGRSTEQGLLGNIPTWPEGRELGILAGTLNAGIGRLLGPVPPPADGTVTVAETYLPGMTDHICLPVSHAGMLLSATVAAQIRVFLNTGKFHHLVAINPD